MSPFYPHFYITKIEQLKIAGGWMIFVWTDIACDLRLYWSNTLHWKHPHPRAERGIIIWEDQYWCVGKQHFIEQNEPGETMAHSFTWTGWEVCWTRYFHFKMLYEGDWGISDTPVYSKHYGVTPQTKFFYPDKHPEITCCDGETQSWVSRTGVLWFTVHDGVALYASASGGSCGADITSGSGTNKWRGIMRSLMLFDTSSIPPTATILAGWLRLWGWSKSCSFTSHDFNFGIVGSHPVSSTDVTIPDFNNLDNITQSDTAIYYDDYKVGEYNEFPLNSFGLASIIKGGISKFGFREFLHDRSNIIPTWQSLRYVQAMNLSVDSLNNHPPELEVLYET